jgi:hypothetical protein
MMVNNYFALAGVALAAFVATVLVLLLNVIPLLGQVFSAFLLSLVLGLAFLVALEIGRRTPGPVQAVTARLSLNRVVELCVVLLPIGILELLIDAAVSFVTLFGFAASIGMRGRGSDMGFLFLAITPFLMVFVAYLKSWIVVKVMPAACYVLAAPKEAGIAPLTRLRQGWSLSRGRAAGFALRYWLIVTIGLLIDLVPFLGVTVGRVLFTDPFILAGIVVIYHRLIARDLPGVRPRARSTADVVAEQAGPY